MTSTRVTRTQALRDRGATRRTSGDLYPFVAWPPPGDGNYAFVEGQVTNVWQSQHGDVATLRVVNHSEQLEAVEGSGDEKLRSDVEPDVLVNVGLSSAQLKGKVSSDDIDQYFHIAFTGWGEARNGNSMRLFEVFELQR